MAARFAPVDLTADMSKLPDNERQALAKLVEAAKVFDALFLRQVWDGNETMLLDLVRDGVAARTRAPALLHDQQGPVVAARSQRAVHCRRAAEAAAGATSIRRARRRTEVEAWMHGAARGRARRAPPGSSRRSAAARTASSSRCPYSARVPGRDRARRGAAARGRGADDAADAQGVISRSAPPRFCSNDYYDSDVAWMELDASIEPTIGPYEVYEDEWFNYKAAFEAFITLRDDAETQKLARFGSRAAGDREQPADRSEVSATPSSGRWRRSASSTPCSRRATATAACRRPPTTCPTTSA